MRRPRDWIEGNFRRTFASPFLLVLVVMGVYVATLLPAVGYVPGYDYYDTAKLQFIGKIWGIPHPTGYPLFIALTHFWGQLFPLGSLAWKINFLSALFSVLTTVTLFLTIRLLGVQQLVAFIACLIFAFTPTVWGQSTIAEVYALQTLFVIGVIYLFVRWNQEKRSVLFYQATAVYALSFTHHLTAVTLLPGIAFITFATDRKVFGNLRKITWVVVIILLSAASYVYLFWRSGDPQLLYFESLVDSRADFWDYVTGGGFRSLMFGFSIWELISLRVPLLIKFFLTEFPLLAGMVAGTIILHLWNQVVNLFLLLLFLGNALFVLSYDIIDFHVFLMPNLLIAAIYVSILLDAIHEYVSTRFKKSSQWPLVALLLVPLILLCLAYPGIAHRNRDSKMVERQILLSLETVEDHAILFTLDDDYMINMDYLYFLHGEDWIKREIYLVDATPDIVRDYITGIDSPRLLRSRAKVPLGLQAYCLENAVDTLRSADYQLVPLSDSLYRIEVGID